MLQPMRTKFRKAHKGRIHGVATRGNYVAFGDYGIMCLEPGWISAQQLEAARVVKRSRNGRWPNSDGAETLAGSLIARRGHPFGKGRPPRGAQPDRTECS